MRAQLSIVSFPIGVGETIVVTVDFTSRRFAGFLVRGAHATKMAGAFRVS